MLKWTTLLFATLTLQAQTPAALPDGPGKPIVQRMCTACHTLKVVTSKRATKDQWTSTVHDMVARGADGTDDEIATVIDYLSTNFPAADKADPPPALSFAPGDDDALLILPQPQFDRMLATWRQAYLMEKKGLGR